MYIYIHKWPFHESHIIGVCVTIALIYDALNCSNKRAINYFINNCHAYQFSLYACIVYLINIYYLVVISELVAFESSVNWIPFGMNITSDKISNQITFYGMMFMSRIYMRRLYWSLGFISIKFFLFTSAFIYNLLCFT